MCPQQRRQNSPSSSTSGGHLPHTSQSSHNSAKAGCAVCADKSGSKGATSHTRRADSLSSRHRERAELQFQTGHTATKLEIEGVDAQR
jgi:hypothetical protein